MNLFNNSKEIVDSFIEEIKSHHVCIDMTLGNGKDSLKIVEKIPQGYLYGLDLQSKAIENSKILFKNHGIDNNIFRFIEAGHENINIYINEKVDFIIYNLGYLPGGDKSIVTQSDTTVDSLSKAIKLLNKGGKIVMTFYLGHPGGEDEYIEVLNYIENLCQKKYTVLNYRFVNQKNLPPQVIAIQKKHD